MALSMDEQRVLAEIERRLAAEDPGLAACMTNFRRPGPAAVLRTPRARIIGSLFTVLLVAMISVTAYAMIPFRAHGIRGPAGHPGLIPSQAQLSAAGTGIPNQTGRITARPKSSAGANGGSASPKTSSTAAGHASAKPATSASPGQRTAKAKPAGR